MQLQLHYLMCTRQQLHKLQRPLARADLAYIWDSHFRKQDYVDKKAFEHFWSWFGQVRSARRVATIDSEFV